MRNWWGRALVLGLVLALVGGACGSDDGDTATGSSGGEARSSKEAAAPKALLDAIPSLFAEDPTPAEDTYVGRVAGSPAYVGLVVHDGQAAVYVCDGVDSEWFGGKVEGDKLSFETEHGTKLTATVAAGNVVGKLSFGDGGAKDFVASRPTGVGPGVFAATGLFRTKHTADGNDYTTGWIVLPDGVRGTTSKAGSTDGFALTTSTNPGETLRSQLPAPGGTRPRNFLAFAGRDSANTVRAGFVRDSSTNGGVAFVSNGKDFGSWLTGTVNATSGRLAAPDGSVLNVSIASGKATLDGTVGGRRIVVIADTAGAAAGLFRAVQTTTDRRRVELGDIVLNDETVTDLASSGEVVYFAAQVESTEPASSDGVLTDESSRTPSGAQPLMFADLKCKLLFLRGARLSAESEGDGATASQQSRHEALKSRYDGLGCRSLYGSFPGIAV